MDKELERRLLLAAKQDGISIVMISFLNALIRRLRDAYSYIVWEETNDGMDTVREMVEFAAQKDRNRQNVGMMRSLQKVLETELEKSDPRYD